MKISILGCGWLGIPLGEYWKQAGHQVCGSTTHENKFPVLQDSGIQPFKIQLTSKGIDGDFSGFIKDATVMVMAIPPGLRKENAENFPEKIHHLFPEIHQSTLEKLIFVSSTSVYGEHQKEVNEHHAPEPGTESGRQLLEAENLIRTIQKPRVCILRLGGLLGPNRHPITFLSGRKDLTSPQAPVNLIQQQEVIEIIDFLLKLENIPLLVNAVYPEHPEKMDYYQSEALKRGLPIPEFTQSHETIGKTVHSKVLIELGYRYRHPI